MATSQQQPDSGSAVPGSTRDPSDLSADEQRMVGFARRFDLRRIIGTVFLVYGAILLVMGLLNNEEDKKQAAGIAINLWTGIVMLVVGALFFLWDRLQPVQADDILGERDEAIDPSGESTSAS